MEELVKRLYQNQVRPVKELTVRGVPGVRLTARERKVAARIAQGLSNRQITSRLVIAERTAEDHVQSFATKLGFSSRAQIAARAVAHGLRVPST